MTSPSNPQDNSPATSPGDLRELFPALHLLRASGLAIDPRKMFLGGIALLLLAAGDWGFKALPFAPANTGRSSSISFARQPEIERFRVRPGYLSRDLWESIPSPGDAVLTLAAPVLTLTEHCRVLFSGNQSWASLAYAWTQLLWALVVWSFIGGALCRMNALQFASRKRIGIWAAMRFSRRQLLGYLVAPILPLSAVVILRTANWLMGFLASGIPTAGNVVLGISWVLVLFSGFLMAMLTIGIAFGWPLMIAAISTEDSDGFDGLSRAFGYLFDRPWSAVFFSLLSVPIFSLMRPLVVLVIALTITMGSQVVEQGWQTGLPDSQITSGYADSGQTAFREMNFLLGRRNPTPWPKEVGDKARVGWTCIPVFLLFGFGPSFFWSATTVSYFLLRKSDDGTPLNSVVDWPEKSDSDQAAESEAAPEAPATDADN
jgi:hypothetical protein